MAATHDLADAILVAVDAYIAGLSDPKADNLVRQDLYRALFDTVEQWREYEDHITIYKTGDDTEGVTMSYNATDVSLDFEFFS